MSNQKVNKNNISIIAGMPRAATTFLYHTLPKHPSIFVPSRKETDYFSVNYYRHIDWYLGFFREMPASHVGFDISPIYFMDQHSPERILKFNPNIKVSLIIRNPVEWILSFYKRFQAQTYKHLDFKLLLNGYTYKKDGKTLKLNFKNSSIKKTILKYADVFGDNLLLCDFGLFDENPLPILKAIETFVGIPSFFNKNNFKNVKLNPGDKQSLKFANILMQQKWFADLITNLFPKKVILLVRYKLQASTIKKNKFEIKRKPDDHKGKYAQEAFAEDLEFVSELFKTSQLLLGKGTPFEY